MKLLVSIVLLSLEQFMLPCLTKKIVGIECPGCGLQRSLMLITNADFIGAYKLYPPIYCIIILLGFYSTQSFIKIKHSNKIIVTLTFITLTFILTNYISKFIKLI